MLFSDKSQKKIGVDPLFSITKRDKIKAVFKNSTNLFNEYYAMTSDDFFNTKSKILTRYGLDVAFVDGLHTYAQSLKDVKNILKVIKEDGVIIMHDCNPPYEAAACPANSYEDAENQNIDGWKGDWCGDVWKALVCLRATRNDLSIFVLDCDYGLGIVTKGTPENTLPYSKEEIDNFSYTDLSNNRRELLNLKSIDYLNEFSRRFDN